jgi:hypothetical protein
MEQWNSVKKPPRNESFTQREKRRQSLIITRSKITPKNVIRKDAIDKVNKKEMELETAKREAEEIKRKAYQEAEATKKKTAEPKKKEKMRSKSVVPRMRETPPSQPQPVPQVPQVPQDLIQLSYTEQLKRRVRDYQYNSDMLETFG